MEFLKKIGTFFPQILDDKSAEAKTNDGNLQPSAEVHVQFIYDFIWTQRKVFQCQETKAISWRIVTKPNVINRMHYKSIAEHHAL